MIKHLESSENPFIVPLLMNCRKDNPELVSKTVPCGIQQNADLLINLDALEERGDIYSDHNGVWIQQACKTKHFITSQAANHHVTGLTKVSREEQADITVRRRSYVSKSCPSYHKLMITIEYGKKIDQWYPIVFLQYRYDGDEVPFQITAHGNRKPGDGKPHVRTKTSTRRKATENLKGKDGPKRALFRTVKDVGGVLGVDNLGTLPRNERQMKYLKEKNVEARGSKPSRDPLATVIELQKAVLPGFIRDVVCNDLPTVILFTDQQIDNLVKFCCLKKQGFVSELGVDLTFQLGPFYLLVTCYKNTLLQVKESNHSPSFLGPMMICLTKDYQTYLSFVHRLLREVPGFAHYLHVYGTDSEDALVNSLAAGFHGSSHLLCYIHCKKNIQQKMKQIGLSDGLAKRICCDLFSRSGLVWSKSEAEFEEKVSRLIEEWDSLERSERQGQPKFSAYFLAHKKQDMKSKICKFVVDALGVGDGPYSQNTPESINDLIKDWNNFKAQEMDKLVLSLYDVVQSFNEEEELAWFGLSEKWKVRKEFEHLCPPPFNSLSPEERQTEMSRIRRIRPDAAAYKECRSFRFQSRPPPQTEASNVTVRNLFMIISGINIILVHIRFVLQFAEAKERLKV